MTKKPLTIRIEEKEKQILDRYSRETGRTFTDIIREFIRSLETITPPLD
jgi:predicted DNA-binding protein